MWQVPVKQYTNLELMDPVTGRKTLQSSIEVTRDEVEDYYGEDGYWCECFAWNTVQGSSNPQHVKSTRALIEAACEYITCSPCSWLCVFCLKFLFSLLI